MEAQRTRHRYDHRFRSIVHETGDIELAVRKGVPRSTARDWSRLAPSEVVTFDVASMSEQELRKEVAQLRKRNATLLAILRLVVVLLKVCEVSLVRRRVVARCPSRSPSRTRADDLGELACFAAVGQ